MNNKNSKNYLRRSVVATVTFSTMLWGLILSILLLIDIELIKSFVVRYKYASILLTLAFLNICAFLQWVILKKIFSQLLAEKKNKSTLSSKPLSKKLKKNINEKDKYLFLYIISALQHKGRFIDFISEDLSLYENDQIAATARVIHEKCKQTLQHYIMPEHILSRDEGEKIDIPPNFDIKAIDLVGNIIGKPPFKGIVKHKGWKLKLDKLPEFTKNNNNPSIVYPAQVEIQ